MMTLHLYKPLVGSGLLLTVLAAARAAPVFDSCRPDPVPTPGASATRPTDPVREANLFPHEDTLCGPFALYLACRSYGLTNYAPLDLARMAAFNGRSTSIDGLRHACDQIGLHAIAAEVNAAALERVVRDSRVRAIVLLRSGHFCYIDQANGGRFRATTYPFTPQWHDAAALSEAWGGPTLLVSREPLPDLAAVTAPEFARAGAWSVGRSVGLGLAAAALSYFGYLKVRGRRSRAAAQSGCES
jgi:hypothetical protein